MEENLFATVITHVDIMMQSFVHTQKDMGYGVRWTFANGMRFDIIDYTKKSQVIFRVGRGAWLVKQYPMLGGWFEQVMTVIAKSEITSLEWIEETHLLGILELLDQAPKWVGAIP